jgi:mono/diheme cytochrome c family protein
VEAEGNGYYKMSCAHCHGDDASGYNGPSLRNLAVGDVKAAIIIREGVKDQMPAFAKKYDDHQVEALVTYLRAVQKESEGRFLPPAETR